MENSTRKLWEEKFKEINRIDGYNCFMETQDGELPLEMRKDWFYKKNPNGKIVVRLEKFSKDTKMLVFNATIYDGKGRKLGNSYREYFCQTERPTADEILNAENRAVESALRWAGYNLITERFWNEAEQMMNS